MQRDKGARWAKGKPCKRNMVANATMLAMQKLMTTHTDGQKVVSKRCVSRRGGANGFCTCTCERRAFSALALGVGKEARAIYLLAHCTLHTTPLEDDHVIAAPVAASDPSIVASSCLGIAFHCIFYLLAPSLWRADQPVCAPSESGSGDEVIYAYLSHTGQCALTSSCQRVILSAAG